MCVCVCVCVGGGGLDVVDMYFLRAGEICVSQNSPDTQIHVCECQGCWWKGQNDGLYCSSVYQKYLKQVTLHNELTLTLLSVIGYRQRMIE